MNMLDLPLLNALGMHWQQFHFLRPWALLALLVLPFLRKALARQRGDSSSWQRVVDPNLLDFLLIGRQAITNNPWPRRLVSLAWVMASLALAGPTWRKLPEPVFESNAPRVLVLDLSASMNANDVTPNRITRARYKLLDVLQRSQEGQVALVAYAGDAHVIAPLTPDARTVASLLPGLSPDIMPKPGSRADRALELAGTLLKNAGMSHGDILLVTDGIDAAQAASAAKSLAGQGFRVSVLGVGTREGAPVPLPNGQGFLKDASGSIVLPKLDPAPLRELASATGGRYATLAADDSDLEQVLSAPMPRDMQQVDARKLTTDRWADMGPWLLVPLLPLGLLAFRRGWLGVLLPLTLTGLLATPRADAFEWRDLWQRQDQQAEAAFNAQHYDEAATKYRDPERQGAAWYRAGDYAKAAEAYAKSDTAEAHYNRGNALARQGKFDEAIRAYDKALQRQPTLADAESNRDLLKKLEALKPKQKPSQDSNASQSQQQNASPQQGQQQNGQNGQNGQNDQNGQSGNTGNSQSSPNAGNADEQPDASGKDNPQAGRGQPTSKESQARSSQPGNPANDAAADSAAQAGHDKADGKPGATAQTPADSAAKPGNEKADANSQGPGQGRPGERQSPLGQEQEATGVAGESQNENRENQHALEQWLRKIPDDPGGLLREKLRRESLRQMPRDDDKSEETPW